MQKNIKALKTVKTCSLVAKIVIMISRFKLVLVTTVMNTRSQIIPYYSTTIGKTVCVKYFVFTNW